MPYRLSRPAVVFVLIAAVSVPWYDYALNRAVQPIRIREHREMFEGTAASPTRYRVLVPFVAELIIWPLAPIQGYDAAFRAVYAGYYGAALFGLLLLLQRYSQLWFSAEQSLIGVLIVAATPPITLRYHTFAPWSILEAVMITAGLTWIARGQTVHVLPLTVIATLNRETAILLPIATFIDAAATPPAARRWSFPIAALALWVATFVMVRFARGPSVDLLTLNAIWAMNVSTQGMKTALPAIALFLGITGWLLTGYGISVSPSFVRRMLWLTVFYLPLYFIFGYWYEVRLLMPLYPVLVPAMVAGTARLAAESNPRMP